MHSGKVATQAHGAYSAESAWHAPIEYGAVCAQLHACFIGGVNFPVQIRTTHDPQSPESGM